MTFTFAAICNKLSKLKLLQEFRSLHISIFVTTNQGTELYSLDIKDEVFKLHYRLRCPCFWAFIDDFHNCRNL